MPSDGLMWGRRFSSGKMPLVGQRAIQAPGHMVAVRSNFIDCLWAEDLATLGRIIREVVGGLLSPP